MTKEREFSGNSDFLFLRAMKGLRQAVVDEVKEEFGVFDLRKLEGASPEIQEKVVIKAVNRAGEEYKKLSYRDKEEQLEQVLEAYQEGRLTLLKFLQGLELRPKMEIGKESGIVDRLKGILSKF